MKYEFQFQNGNISEGSNIIYIKGGIAEIEPEALTPAMQLLIEANGGQLVKEKPKGKTKTKKAGD